MSTERDKVIVFSPLRREAHKDLLERLFREYRLPLRAFIWARIGRRDDWEDILQDAFYRLARMDDLVDKLAGHRNPRAYLLTIVNHLLVDYLRKDIVRNASEVDTGEEAPEGLVEVTPETLVANSEQLDHIKAVLRQLKPQYRTAFVLYRFHNLTGREVAEHMGVSESGAEKFIARAMKAIVDARIKP